jgi:hypothetical protein
VPAALPCSFHAAVCQLKIKVPSTALPQQQQQGEEGGAIELAYIQAHIDSSSEQQPGRQQPLSPTQARMQAPAAGRRTTGSSQSNVPLLAAAASNRSLLAGASQRWLLGSSQPLSIKLQRNLSGPLQQFLVPGSLLRDR